MKGNPATGIGYLIEGLKLITQPGLRLFVLIPLTINILIFAILIAITVGKFYQWIEGFMSWLPGWDWLDFIRWIIWPLVVGLLLVVVMYTFSIIANLIAAPFNNLLAEKVEEHLTGEEVFGKETIAMALKDAPRSIGKEIQKLLYYLPRALGVLILSLILSFMFPPLATLLWFGFGAWMMAMDYCDYPMENHKHSLRTVRETIALRRATSYGFGGAVMLGTMIPIVNFVVMPAAVCGATVYWVKELKANSAVVPAAARS